MFRSIVLTLALFFLICGSSFAEGTPGVSVSRDQVAQALMGAVKYLEGEQKKVTSGDDFFKGEWPSRMMSARTIPFVAKKGKAAYDSNSFTVSSIHSILASIWLRQNWLESIPEVLDRSTERILSYRNGETFNFWPLLKPISGYDPSRLARRPNHFYFRLGIAEAGCNVYDDADDTALALNALKLYQEVRPSVIVELPVAPGRIFSPYRDVGRKKPHFYNAFHGVKNTGAFLTWLQTEQLDDWHSYVPQGDKSYIPFGMNDVDCVVNANILATLARFSDLGSEGVEETCKFIEWAFKKGKQKTCGVYYPSPYNFHYTVAKAYDAGAACLKGAVQMAVKEIIKSQLPTGGWKSDIQGDDVHTSLYALNALLYAGDFDKTGTRKAVSRAMAYALSQGAARTDGGLAWPEGIFFSGGTLARHKIYWKSEAYTTALAADAFSLYLSGLSE